MDRYYDCCKSGACIYNLSGRDIPYNPAESDSVCEETLKIGLFAAATNSSAATLPLNTKTCTEELGCSKEISSFVLPTGMTINMKVRQRCI